DIGTEAGFIVIARDQWRDISQETIESPKISIPYFRRVYQFPATAKDICLARVLRPKSSEVSTHAHGPQEAAKAAMKVPEKMAVQIGTVPLVALWIIPTR